MYWEALAVACALAISGSACGRIGYDSLSDADAGPVSDSDSGVARSDGGGASGVCTVDNGAQCFGSNVLFSIGGSTILGGEVVTNDLIVVPTCGASNGAAYRVRLVAPSQRVRLTITVEAEFDVLLSLYSEECDGATLSCTAVAAGSGTEVVVDMEPGEAVIASADAVNGCGIVSIQSSAIRR